LLSCSSAARTISSATQHPTPAADAPRQDSTVPSAVVLDGQLRWAIEKSKNLGVALNATPSMLGKAIDQRLHEVGDLYLDDAISGYDLSRPGFRAFVDRAVKQGGLHCFVWARDRLARPENPCEAMVIESNILRAGNWLIVGEGIDCGPRERGKTYFNEDLQALLEYSEGLRYLHKLAEGVTLGQSMGAMAGYVMGGRAPYGFVRASLNTNTGKTEVLTHGKKVRGYGYRTVFLPGDDEDGKQKLDVVRRIAIEYNTGKGLKAITRRLNEDGIPSPNAACAHKKKPSGRWNERTVSGILRNPLYKGKIAWGRRGEGKFRRHDKSSPGSMRLTRADAINPETEKGRVEFYDDPKKWVIADPAKPFEPVVLPGIWDANFSRLNEMGKKRGGKGVRRVNSPARYPLQVICGDCNRPMVGSEYNHQPCYKCSTYGDASQEDKCHHNWVNRDVIVQFAAAAVSREISRLMKNKHVLKHAIKREFESINSFRRSASKPTEELRKQRDRRAKEAGKIRAEMANADDFKADALKETYELLLDQGRSDDLELRAREKRGELKKLDLDKEVGQSMELLRKLRRYLLDVHKDRYYDLFSGMGLRIVVAFEHLTRGRRRNIPVGGQIFIGYEGEFTLPVEVNNGDESTGGRGGSKRKKAASRGSGCRTVRGKNRGDRI
jgi:hypothetical protein